MYLASKESQAKIIWLSSPSEVIQNILKHIKLNPPTDLIIVLLAFLVQEHTHGWAGRRAVESCIILLQFGCLVAYLNILADTMSSVAGTPFLPYFLCFCPLYLYFENIDSILFYPLIVLAWSLRQAYGSWQDQRRSYRLYFLVPSSTSWVTLCLRNKCLI